MEKVLQNDLIQAFLQNAISEINVLAKSLKLLPRGKRITLRSLLVNTPKVKKTKVREIAIGSKKPTVPIAPVCGTMDWYDWRYPDREHRNLFDNEWQELQTLVTNERYFYSQVAQKLISDLRARSNKPISWTLFAGTCNTDSAAKGLYPSELNDYLSRRLKNTKYSFALGARENMHIRVRAHVDSAERKTNSPRTVYYWKAKLEGVMRALTIEEKKLLKESNVARKDFKLIIATFLRIGPKIKKRRFIGLLKRYEISDWWAYDDHVEGIMREVASDLNRLVFFKKNLPFFVECNDFELVLKTLPIK